MNKEATGFWNRALIRNAERDAKTKSTWESGAMAEIQLM